MFEASNDVQTASNDEGNASHTCPFVLSRVDRASWAYIAETKKRECYSRGKPLVNFLAMQVV